MEMKILEIFFDKKANRLGILYKFDFVLILPVRNTIAIFSNSFNYSQTNANWIPIKRTDRTLLTLPTKEIHCGEYQIILPME